MNLLSRVESCQLFLQKAFKGDQPNEDYLELSKIVIESANGLPLGLNVFASFLCGCKSEWEDALQKVPPNGILEIFKVSFDGLEYNEKTIFLDIACFFNGMLKDNVMQILENSGLYPEIGVKVLIEKSLVTEYEGCLWVHDMLQEMGKKIVFLESPNDAGKRSRIWSVEDANHVLRNKRGTEAIHGIAVRFDKPYIIHLDPEAFSSMSNLKFLVISTFSHGQLNLHHGLNCLPNTLKVIELEMNCLETLVLSGCSKVKKFPSLVKASSGNHYSLLKRAFRLQRPSSSTKFQWSPSFSNLSSLVRLDAEVKSLA